MSVLPSGTPDERHGVEDRILDALRRMTDPATGEAVVTRAWRRSELYGDICPAFVPEILFEFREGFTGAVDPDADDVVADATEGQNGTHRADGMFVLAGRAVRPLGPVGPLHLVDVAPLTLRLCGVGAPADLDGRLPVELLDPEAVGTSPDSTGSGKSPGAPSGPPGPAQSPYTPEQEQQVKEHLRRLGYL